MSSRRDFLEALIIVASGPTIVDLDQMALVFASALKPPYASDVRFGSLAHMCDAKPDVRFVLIADIARFD